MKKIVITVICFLTSIVICHANDWIINRNIDYPYIASTERADKIRNESNKLQIGMGAGEVIEILNLPDETKPLFEPKLYQPDQIGYTHWYLIQRYQKDGSVNEKKEILLRISYDLNWNVTKIDHWGFNK